MIKINKITLLSQMATYWFVIDLSLEVLKGIWSKLE